MTEKLLEIKNLTVQYVVYENVIEAVNNLSLEIAVGETLGLVGETGAGKTTTGLGILGLIPTPPGKVVGREVFYKGRDITKISEKELRNIRGSEITMIFQDPMTSLNPVLTVGEQIAEVISLHSNVTEAQAQKRASEMLEIVGISGERHKEYPHQFSGGMKQRVMIAMSLACSPSLLVADEPTTALDVTIQAQVLELMGKLKKEFNSAMLLITHDFGVVAEVCDKVAIMYAGEIVEYGTLADIFLDKRHPYTMGLFDSIPNLSVDTDRLKTIPGMMPDPSNLPKGCSFCPRCTSKLTECEINKPEVVEIKRGHFVKCHIFANKGGAQNYCPSRS